MAFLEAVFFRDLSSVERALAAEQFGIIEACSSVGIVIGGIFMPWFAEQFGLMRTLLFFSIVLSLPYSFLNYERKHSSHSLFRSAGVSIYNYPDCL